MAALDRHQCIRLALEGRGDQHFGRIPWQISGLVHDQLEAVVIALPPGDVILARHPHVSRSARLVAVRIQRRELEAVNAAVGWGKTDRGFAVLIHHHLVKAGHRDLLYRGFPNDASLRILRLNVVPAPLDDLHADLLPGQQGAIPIHRHQVEGLFLARRAHVALRARPHIDRTAMNDQRIAPTHRGAGQVCDRRLEGKLARLPGLTQLGGQLYHQLAICVGTAHPLGDHLAARRSIIIIVVITIIRLSVGKVVIAQFIRWGKEVTVRQQRPVHLCAGHCPARIIAGLDGRGKALARQQVLWQGLYTHLELGLTVFCHAEPKRADHLALRREVDVDRISAQGCLCIQQQHAVKAAEFRKRQHFLVNRLFVAVNHHPHFGPIWQAVIQVVIRAHDPLEIHRLPGAVKRPLGVCVSDKALSNAVVIVPNAVIVQRHVAVPTAGRHGKN